MKNGCILCGGVGSGKSRTSLAYYYQEQGGKVGTGDYVPMNSPKDLYIITTARKRDTCEWEGELAPFLLSTHPESNYYKNKVVVDSWNNIGKYKEVTNAFFIFDEQRVVGYGAWTKAFLKIAKSNRWILLSATPGDTWQDYIPVFIANGFYRNKTDFIDQHVVYDWRAKYPKIDRYLNTGRLIRLRDRILVTMDFQRQTVSHHEDVAVPYDIATYKTVMRRRWNLWEDRPIETAGELCYSLRRVVNSDEARSVASLNWLRAIPKSLCSTILTTNWIFSNLSTTARGLRLPNGTVTSISRFRMEISGFIWFSTLPDVRAGTASPRTPLCFIRKTILTRSWCRLPDALTD